MAEADMVGGEVGELYRRLAKPLERIVRGGVRAPEQVIEDACQFAWTRLLHHRGRVRRDAALAWLVKTATREALKLAGRATRDVSLDAKFDEGAITAVDLRPGPAVICEQRDRLTALSALTPRQQRWLWLSGLGLGYREISRYDGCTARTVERQLQRARAQLRAADLGR